MGGAIVFIKELVQSIAFCIVFGPSKNNKMIRIFISTAAAFVP